MKISEKTIRKQNKHPSTLRSAWVLIIACLCLFLGITSVLSSSQRSTLSTPILSWTETTSLNQALAGKNAVVYDVENDGQDDYVFFIGGRDSQGNPVAAVHSAAFTESGTIGAWQSVQPLPRALFLHSAVVANDTIYVVGGWKGSEPTEKAAYRAQIRSNGTLGSWVPSQEYPIKVSQHGSTVVTLNEDSAPETYIYGIGGWEGSFAYSQVYYSKIDADGSIVEWLPATSLPVSMRRVAVQSVGNTIYVTGGYDENKNTLDTVYRGIVDSTGRVNEWTNIAQMPQGIFYHRAVIHDDNLVVLGGKRVNDGVDQSAVYSAPILANGQLGAWDTTIPSMPQGLFRFAAVSVRRWNSDYIMVLGGGQGLNASPTVRNEVYYSDVPPTPTPTSTPTPTPTPTPPVTIDLEVSNEPAGWVAPGEEIVYTIRYTNDGPGAASSTRIDSKIPANTEFVSGSGIPAQTSLSGTTEGSDISWSVGLLAPNSTGTIQYKVRRVESAAPQQGAIEVGLTGPAVGTASQVLTYTLNITNFVGGGLGSTTVDIQLPAEATYISSSNGGSLGPGNTLVWTASGLPSGTWSLDFALSAEDSFVIHDYEVRAQLIGTTDIVCCGVGQDVLVTEVNGQPVRGNGDGVSIINDDVEISWMYNGQAGTFEAAQVQNPRAATNRLFLPLTADGSPQRSN